MDISKYGVHRTHCCIRHGCKYGDKDCPVVSGEIKQEYLCEWCGEEEINSLEELAESMIDYKTMWKTLKMKFENELSKTTDLSWTHIYNGMLEWMREIESVNKR